MNLVKDVNNSVQKLKVHSQVESKLDYANNAFNMEFDILPSIWSLIYCLQYGVRYIAFNMELDILIVILTMENSENTGEYGRRIQNAEF